jgi:hypothetical protein
LLRKRDGRKETRLAAAFVENRVLIVWHNAVGLLAVPHPKRKAAPKLLLSERLTRPSGGRVLVVLAVALAVAMALSIASAGQAEARKKTKPFTKTSTVAQSGFADFTNFNPPITAQGNPYSFSKTRKIVKLNRVTITATIMDGNTALPFNFDENDLTLALDGIDTGIALNGFPGGAQTATVTISGRPNNSRAIRDALKADKSWRLP